MGGLVALGLMNGIVPTIDALAILLVALNIAHVFLGIELILAHSFGLVSVLIAVGTLIAASEPLTNLVLTNHDEARPRKGLPSTNRPGRSRALV